MVRGIAVLSPADDALERRRQHPDPVLRRQMETDAHRGRRTDPVFRRPTVARSNDDRRLRPSARRQRQPRQYGPLVAFWGPLLFAARTLQRLCVLFSVLGVDEAIVRKPTGDFSR